MCQWSARYWIKRLILILGMFAFSFCLLFMPNRAWPEDHKECNVVDPALIVDPIVIEGIQSEIDELATQLSKREMALVSQLLSEKTSGEQLRALSITMLDPAKQDEDDSLMTSKEFRYDSHFVIRIARVSVRKLKSHLATTTEVFEDEQKIYLEQKSWRWKQEKWVNMRAVQK